MSWYKVDLSNNQDLLFTGYFKANGGDVVEFYETIAGVTNFSQNILSDGSVPRPADNTFDTVTYSFTPSGVNIQSTSLQTNLATSSFYFNLSTPILSETTFIEYNDGNINLDHVIEPLANDPSCFNEGTTILCLNKNLEEEYIPIECLKKGDVVKSYKHGYRRIDVIYKNVMINNPDKFNQCMYLMERTDDNGLIDDLIVTGGHSILVDDLGIYKEENDLIFGGIQMIDDKYLLLAAVSKDFVKLMTHSLYTYYHIILENNGNDDERFGVWANGILTETPPKQHFIDHIRVE